MSTKLAKSGVLIQTKAIRTPDNFAALLAEPRIKRLAASIKGVTQIAPIVVQPMDGGGYKLWAGHDRFAAITLAGKQTIRADIRTGSEADFLLLQLAENDERRHQAELVTEYVAKAAESLKAGEGQNGDLSPPSKAQARAAIAGAKGIQPESMRKAEQRARKRDEITATSAAAAEKRAAALPLNTGATEGLEAAPEPDTLDRLGLEDASSKAVMNFARKDQDAIDRADQLLRQAQTALMGMTPGPVQQELHAQVHRVASLVRSHRPEAICPWCKGLPKADVPPCKPCGGAGYVSAEVKARAPAELRDGPTLVAIDGQFIPYMDAKAGKLPGKNGAPKKPGKRFEVTLPDGRSGDPEVLADEDQVY